MKKFLTFALVFGLALFLGYGLSFAGQGADDPPPGKHYNLNIIGFAQCTKKNDTDPDCFKGNAGDIITHGHTIFVPLETDWVVDPCQTDGESGLTVDDNDVLLNVAELKKGVRILVSDGDDMIVADRDATDGTAKFILPDGCYEVYARPLGKPNGCMDIDTIICFDYDTQLEEYVQVDCKPSLLNDQYVLVGHLDVDRTKNGSNKPHWQNATDELLPSEVGVGDGISVLDSQGNEKGYYDFFWQIFNNNLRLLQLRFYKVDCP